MAKRECYVAIEFDGACVTNDYPDIGRDIGADVWLRPAVTLGAKLILYSNRDDIEMEDALRWFEGHCIEIWAVNENPAQAAWTDSRKPFYNTLIDPAALGTPLLKNPRKKPYVDWGIQGPALLKKIAGVLGPQG